MSVKQPTWCGWEGQIVLREAWEEFRAAFPEATESRHKLIWVIEGGDPVTPAGSTQNSGRTLGLDFRIHPDLTVTCSAGYRPVIREGVLMGFEKEEA